MSENVTVTRTVDARPEQIFALLSTPDRHHEFDGAGMLRGVDGPGEVSGIGDQFVMNMRNDVLGDYQMLNTVTAYEQDREIAWAPQLHPLDGYTDKLGNVTAKGHTWTWRLAPAGGGTEVTQVYDWSGVADPDFKGFFPLVTEDQMTQTIDKVADAAS
ncbi:polyketide cyclase [Actinomycetospora sp. NBRC 106375]|uniref:SRPBCC family protein n=1 Tax=Actinomycetospora sp. NBRC 106375 TaxID=3032207 RepID=UPI0024A08F66|nr:SRPBCC family protein [Actinomycetospora sp. NBRC 106375]GLZ44478.1 polyketide cyclase [Actinomycetospora sp. NBRC 106375]